MAKPQNFTIKESLDELKKLRKRQRGFKFEKRALWLIYLKEQKFKTRKELCEYLGINPRTQQRWSKQYREKGIEYLLTELLKERKSKTITPEIHRALGERLNSSTNGFLGYWQARMGQRDIRYSHSISLVAQISHHPLWDQVEKSAKISL